jgi:hypothetical protein
MITKIPTDNILTLLSNGNNNKGFLLEIIMEYIS